MANVQAQQQQESMSQHDLSRLITEVAKEVLQAYRKGQEDQLIEDSVFKDSFFGREIKNAFVEQDTNYVVLANNYIQKKANLDIPLERRNISQTDIDGYYEILFDTFQLKGK